MKEFCGSAANFCLTADADGPFRSMAEITVIVSEPVYSFGIDGLKRNRDISQFRFGIGIKAMRNFAQHLTEYADSLEALVKRVEPPNA